VRHHCADKIPVPVTSTDVVFPALWTFQRGDETITVLREIVDAKPTLTVADKGETRSISFDDVMTLTIYQSDIERQLVEDGWSLASFAPDLRSGGDRRKAARSDSDRRRA
jgi:hypothetical protein